MSWSSTRLCIAEKTDWDFLGNAVVPHALLHC